ncbi:hypothetical protein BD779DRAFT_1504068 [Infundibulicybe gibba]|nr:hypothetical protein BD779DRAFT_1504068 [Infundibulicybe gibba]
MFRGYVYNAIIENSAPGTIHASGTVSRQKYGPGISHIRCAIPSSWICISSIPMSGFDMDDDLYNSDAWTLFIIRGVSCSLLCFVALEWLVSLPAELSLIWRLYPTTLIKRLYIFSRYYGLASLIGNTAMTWHIHSLVTPPAPICRSWHVFQFLTLQGLLLSLELVLVLRVFALYNRERGMGIFLFSALAIDMMGMSTCGFLTIARIDFGGACLPKWTPPQVMYYSVLELCFQSLLFTLTIYKQTARPQLRWQHSAIGAIVTRDSLAVFFLLGVLFVAVILNTVSQNLLCYIGFTLSTALFSSIGCRLTINMLSVSDSELVNDEDASTIQFTTVNHE